ncbi:MAG: redoxin family protein [Vicinamibacterales bacterium]|jgi:peroxiredoxin
MLLHLILALLLATPSGPAQAGRHIDGPGPTRVLDLAGSSVNPLVLAPRRVAIVLVFTTTDCPISNRYAPEIQRLAARFQKQGIGFTVVYPVSTDTPPVIREHLKKFGYALPVVRDTAQELVKHTGVQVTPEVAVVGAGGRVLYKGRIDDRYIEFGRDRPQPTERTLERALEAIVQGKAVAVRETQAVGCILADLVK